MIYLQDVKDSKANPCLNRLEQSIHAGYLQKDIESEEVAFAIMYYRVCAPLLAKAKNAKSPLVMNWFYEAAIDALGL